MCPSSATMDPFRRWKYNRLSNKLEKIDPFVIVGGESDTVMNYGGLRVWGEFVFEDAIADY